MNNKEKIYFENSRGANLVGVLHTPEKVSNSVVIISHGFTSNKDRTRFVKLAETLLKNGFTDLRFDFKCKILLHQL